MSTTSNFGIVVGRWTGMFSMFWYADVVHESDTRPYMTFNALTKRGAMKKADRYIRRVIGTVVYDKHDIYVFDLEKNKLVKHRAGIG